MTHPNRVITPATPTEITQTPDMGAIQNMKRPGGDRLNITVHQHHYHQAPAPEQRPSHYLPVPIVGNAGEVARWGIGAMVALLGCLAIGQALIHQSNMNFLNYQTQFDRVNNVGHRLSNY